MVNDPLQLSDKPTAIDTRIVRAAAHPDIQRLYERITNLDYGDSVEVRVLLIAHLNYLIYRDIKEALAR